MVENKRALPARIEYLRVENYRALEIVELKNLTPLAEELESMGRSEQRELGRRLAILFAHR